LDLVLELAQERVTSDQHLQEQHIGWEEAGSDPLIVEEGRADIRLTKLMAQEETGAGYRIPQAACCSLVVAVVDMFAFSDPLLADLSIAVQYW